MCEVFCVVYLKDCDGICPVRVRILPGFALHQAFGKHIQIEDGVVFRVLDLTLEQLHDVQECLQRTADVYDYRKIQTSK